MKEKHPEQLRQQVGRKIKDIRTLFGLSQQELADKADLSQSAIAQFERGDRLPSTTALQGIAKALGLSMEKLLSENESSPNSSKELLLEQLVKKARNLSNEDILQLNRWVEKIRPEEE